MKKKISFCKRKILQDDSNNKNYFLKRKATLEILLNALEKLINDTDEYFEEIDNVNN
jgi:hypothetical protein